MFLRSFHLYQELACFSEAQTPAYLIATYNGLNHIHCRKTGYLCMENSPYPDLEETEAALKAIGASYEVLSAAEANKRYPMLNCKRGYKAIYEACGGVLRANRCLMAYQVWSRSGERLMNDSLCMQIYHIVNTSEKCVCFRGCLCQLEAASTTMKEFCR